MPYRSTEKTRQKKDAKRTAMMQAAVRVFADKGYQAATVRDIVQAADVSIGTFYFYFPDKETLFLHLYEETAAFFLQTIRQSILARVTLPQQIGAGLQAYINIAIYEPAVIQLLLLSGIGTIPSLLQKEAHFRESLIKVWQHPLDIQMQKNLISFPNSRRLAEALTGSFNEVILNLLKQKNPDLQAEAAIQELTEFALRATAYTGN